MGQKDNLTFRPVWDAAAMLGIMDRRFSATSCVGGLGRKAVLLRIEKANLFAPDSRCPKRLP